MPQVADLLAAPLQLGDPDVSGPLTVFPIFGALAPVRFSAFANAACNGLTVTELPGGASVNDLVVENTLDEAVLIFEGEEVTGAQQNRTFDVSVLVAPRSRQIVPVGCVEAGRWDGRRHRDAFRPAPQAAYPELRRRKNEAARRHVANGRRATR